MRRVHRVSALLLVAGGLLVLPAGAGAVDSTVTASPSSLTFAAQAVGTTSAAQQVTLTKDCTGGNNTLCLSNPGDQGPTFNTAISVPAPFHQTNDCPAALGAGPDTLRKCTINVTFAPTLATIAYGTLMTGTGPLTGAPGPTVSLTGTGTPAPATTGAKKKKCKRKKGAGAAKKKKCKKKKKAG